MCADHNIKIAARKAAQDLLLLLGGAESRKHFHPHRKGAHTRTDGLIMLQCQNGGGHQDRHLLAGKHRLIGRAKGHLGLAKAHVPAKQSVHGGGAHHILLDLIRRGHLPLGLFVFKRGLKVALIGVIGGKSKALTASTLRIQVDEILGHILGGRLRTRLGLFPLTASKARKLHHPVITACTDIF